MCAYRSLSSTVGRLLVVILTAGALAGCAVSGNAIDNATTVSAITMAEPAPTIAADPFIQSDIQDDRVTDRLLDEDTLRLAVTTADLSSVPADGLGWASAATGAHGKVTNIVETKNDGVTCRAFAASRQAYDGITLYNGEVCLDPRSGWWTRTLAPLT